MPGTRGTPVMAPVAGSRVRPWGRPPLTRVAPVMGPPLARVGWIATRTWPTMPMAGAYEAAAGTPEPPVTVMAAGTVVMPPEGLAKVMLAR